MAVDLANIGTGMEVYDSNGDKIGTIDDILVDKSRQSGMDAYQEARMANVATDETTDDADAEQYTTAQRAGNWNDDDDASAVGPVGALDSAGEIGAGMGSAPGGRGFAPIGAEGSSGLTLDDGTTTGAGQPPAAASTVTGNGYMHVKEGGVLGIGAKDLYIPVDAVQNVDPGDRVTLSCTKDEAESRFTTAPDTAAR